MALDKIIDNKDTAPQKLSAPPAPPQQLSAKQLQEMFNAGTLPLEDVVKRLQIAEMLKTAVKAQEDAEQRAASQKAFYDNIEAAERNKEMEQAQCSHRKENYGPSGNKTRVVGQRAHSGAFVLTCSWCGKMWTKLEDVPPDLQPQYDNIGSV